MNLMDYLTARKETTKAFALRAGLGRQTVQVILSGKSRPRIDIAKAIVDASRVEPAPDGGTVRYEDLPLEAPVKASGWPVKRARK